MERFQLVLLGEEAVPDLVWILRFGCLEQGSAEVTRAGLAPRRILEARAGGRERTGAPDGCFLEF